MESRKDNSKYPRMDTESSVSIVCGNNETLPVQPSETEVPASAVLLVGWISNQSKLHRMKC